MQGQAEITVHYGGKKILITVDRDDTRDVMLGKIVDTINNDPDCCVHVFVDDGSICQSPVADLEFRCMPDADSPMVFHEKKGRRRGQRFRDFPRK